MRLRRVRVGKLAYAASALVVGHSTAAAIAARIRLGGREAHGRLLVVLVEVAVTAVAAATATTALITTTTVTSVASVAMSGCLRVSSSMRALAHCTLVVGDGMLLHVTVILAREASKCNGRLGI